MMTIGIKASECRHVTHIPAGANNRDAHFVKEFVHYEDGTTAPRFRMILDYQRPFYITKKSHRNYKDHKEWIPRDHVTEYSCTQSDLVRQIAKALNIRQHPRLSYRDLTHSPYLYGSDVSSCSIIKQSYLDQYSDIVSMYDVAFLDTETWTEADDDPGPIFILTICHKKDLKIYVDKEWFYGLKDPYEGFKSVIRTELQPEMDKEGHQVELIVCDHEMDILIKAFAYLHSRQPDIVSIWNMEFDITRIITACNKAKYPIEDLISDPSVLPEYRRFRFSPGSVFKAKSKDGKQNAGNSKPLNPSERWHRVLMTASFTFLDGMCTYRRIRIGRQEDPKTSLDYILNKEGIGGKFKLTEFSKLTGIEWHKAFRSQRPFLYMVYGLYDTFRMQQLDNKIKDLCMTLPISNQSTEFNYANSQQKKIADFFHFFCLKAGYVLGIGASARPDSPSSEAIEGDEEEEDEIKVLSLKRWIAILESHLMRSPGLKLVKGSDNLNTFIRLLIADLDCISSYPSDSIALNISKTTTKTEINEVLDVDETQYRLGNINLLSGHVNALTYLQELFNYPRCEEVLAEYLVQRKPAVSKPNDDLFDI